MGMLMNQRKSDKTISQLNNTQLICSYLFLQKTAKHYYHKQLSTLFKKEREAIIRDLSLFESIKKQKYSLRCSTPQKWLEANEAFKKLKIEIMKRKISINNFDIAS